MGGILTNRVEYMGKNVGRRDILETVNKENVYYWQLYIKYLYETKGDTNKTDYLYKISVTLGKYFMYLYENKDDKCILDVTADELEDYFYFQKKEMDLSTYAIGHEYRSLKRFYNFLILKNIIFNNPFNIIKPPNEKDSDYLKTIFLTDEQMDLLKYLPQYLKIYAMFSISTGAKIDDVMFLKWNDIDFEKRIANVNGSTLYMSTEVAEALKKESEYREENNIVDHGYVFRNKDDRVKKNKGYTMKTDETKKGTVCRWCAIIGEKINAPTLSHNDFRYTAVYRFLSASGSVGMTSIVMNYPNLTSSAKMLCERGNQQNEEILSKYKELCEI